MNAIQFLSSQPWVPRFGWTLIHFLWQGALVAILYAFAQWRIERSSSPGTRYTLACVALAAMVISPFITWSLLRSPEPGAVATQFSGRISGASTSVTTLPAPVLATVSGASSGQLLFWVVAIWLAGAICLWVRLIGGWVVTERLRFALVRAAPAEWQRTLDILKTRVRVSRPVRLLVSSLVQVPTVVGWLRPIILIPVGALAGLPFEHLEALLIHELAHIRRHDYLVNILQSIVEALLFYHPAVWWVSGHIRREREMCCDDVAVSVIGNPLIYARALAEVESSRPAHLRVAVAANGGSLVDRIGRLLGQSQPRSRALSGPGFAASAILLVVAVYGLFGQSAAAPRFEVASIKPNTVTDRRAMRVSPMPGGRLVAENASLQLLMINAYALPPFQISGGPNWINSDRYDIEAKGEDSGSGKQVMLMLQALLEDRFKLKTHRETKELSVYALAVARSGKLQAPKEDGCLSSDSNTPARAPASGQSPAPCGRIIVSINLSGVTMRGGKIAMAELTRILTMIMGRTVIDKTGFTGTFDVNLKFIYDDALAGLPGRPGDPDKPAPPADPAGPSIFAALQEHVGLKLESTKGPLEVLVIDHVERPSEN